MYLVTFHHCPHPCLPSFALQVDKLDCLRHMTLDLQVIAIHRECPALTYCVSSFSETAIISDLCPIQVNTHLVHSGAAARFLQVVQLSAFGPASCCHKGHFQILQETCFYTIHFIIFNETLDLPLHSVLNVVVTFVWFYYILLVQCFVCKLFESSK